MDSARQKRRYERLETRLVLDGNALGLGFAGGAFAGPAEQPDTSHAEVAAEMVEQRVAGAVDNVAKKFLDARQPSAAGRFAALGSRRAEVAADQLPTTFDDGDAHREAERRLQDLQITIEVRFITLQDNFFERIGIDFDFDIDDNVNGLPYDDDGQPNITVGFLPDNISANAVFSNFIVGAGTTRPDFDQFDPQSPGFGILSNIEAFFFIQVPQGDSRTNITEAPKVTLFNGQLAVVFDTTNTPFVISVIPVVG